MRKSTRATIDTMKCEIVKQALENATLKTALGFQTEEEASDELIETVIALDMVNHPILRSLYDREVAWFAAEAELVDEDDDYYPQSESEVI